MSLVIVGSIGLDTVKTPFGFRSDVLGGSCSYCSVSASYFTDVMMVGVAGDDFPQENIELYEKHNIDLSGLERVSGETFRWHGHYNYNLSNAVTDETCLGVFEHFKPKIPDTAKDAEYVFLANIQPGLQTEVLDQVFSPNLSAADTMNLWIDIAKPQLGEVIKRVKLFTLNEGEARMYTGEYNLKKAAAALMALGPEMLIIKRGEYGAMLFAGERSYHVPAFPVDNIQDPTGAGDTFAGGVMGYLAATGERSFEGLREAILYGTVMASFTVEGFSLERLGNLSRDEIATRHKELVSMISYHDCCKTPW